MQLSKQLDKHLLNLAWSLWTALGVNGTLNKHQQTLIMIEELILFTSVLSEVDPRLRDEAIDWCSEYYKFVSMSRLKSLIENFEKEHFSRFASAVNAVSSACWITFMDVPSQIVSLSRKSVLRPHASPALLNIRARSIFGVGARADILTFCLVEDRAHFSIAEVTEIGYTKRNLAEVLDDLHFADLFSRFMQGNQLRYRFNKDSRLADVLSPIPKHYKNWRIIFKVLLFLRECIKRTETSAESTKVIEFRNCLETLDPFLQKLQLNPPSFSGNFSSYLDQFTQWLLEWAASLAEGK